MEVFLATPWIPREWVEVYGLTPRGLFCMLGTGLTGAYKSEGLCSFAQQTLEFALARAGNGSAVVFGTSCDQMRRCFDLIEEQQANLFLFNLPATWQSETACRLFQLELQRFSRFLERLGGHRPTKEHVARTLQSSCEARLILTSAWENLGAREYAELIADFHWEGRVITAPRPAVDADSGIPVALVGGPLTRAYFTVLDAIESAGGRVVLNATETGERSLGLETPLQDRIATGIIELAQLFFSRIVDVWQRPNTRLYSWLRERIAKRNVRGIVLWHHVACDLWRAEAASLKEAFGLPVLALDSEQAYVDHPRLMHRIAAFMEMLS